jgi:DNA-nicking Smr family endonuclease
LKRIPIEDSFDLHSFSPRDVVPAASDYLDAAREQGLLEVRLIHGKGTGTQRAAIRRMLSERRDVVEFSDAPPDRGSYGATRVRLRKGSGLKSS